MNITDSWLKVPIIAVGNFLPLWPVGWVRLLWPSHAPWSLTDWFWQWWIWFQVMMLIFMTWLYCFPFHIVYLFKGVLISILLRRSSSSSETSASSGTWTNYSSTWGSNIIVIAPPAPHSNGHPGALHFWISAPNHTGKGIEPLKSSKFFPKNVPQTIRKSVECFLNPGSEREAVKAICSRVKVNTVKYWLIFKYSLHPGWHLLKFHLCKEPLQKIFYRIIWEFFPKGNINVASRGQEGLRRIIISCFAGGSLYLPSFSCWEKTTASIFQIINFFFKFPEMRLLHPPLSDILPEAI